MGILFKKKERTTMIAFVLSMPNVGSWNGKWSGENHLYCRVYKNAQVPQNLWNKDFCYNFGDGWVARIKVLKVDAIEGGKMKRKSKGFYGYDWMIASLLKHGEIK
jgi:hypothetical protein